MNRRAHACDSAGVKSDSAESIRHSHAKGLSHVCPKAGRVGIENNRKLIVNCLPLTPSEQAQFMRAAKGVPQEFVGDPAQRGNMAWTAIIPEELKAQVTAIIGNVDPGTCDSVPNSNGCKPGAPASTNTSDPAFYSPDPCSGWNSL